MDSHDNPKASVAVMRIHVMEWIHRSGKDGEEARRLLREAETHEAAGDELESWFGEEFTEAEKGPGPFDRLKGSLAYAALGFIQWHEVARMLRDPAYNFEQDRQFLRMMHGIETINLSSKPPTESKPK